MFVLAERYEPVEGPWHSHRRAQLLHASEGVLTVRTSAGLWVVPPQREVILDRLPQLKVSPLHLPSPRDTRLKSMTDALAMNPADARTLGELATVAGMTERTVARLFLKETGLTFGQWRRQLRLLAALERLGAGESVSNVALDVGYEDVSSFIAVFKAALGDTPARYFR